MGEPWLTRLGIPYRLACLLDAGVIFLAGYLVRDYVDVALGFWLILGGFGLALLVVMGTQQQFRDTADLMDAGHYAGNIQDRVERPDTGLGRQTFAASADDPDEVSTAARGQRK